jgi:hypothetical protein
LLGRFGTAKPTTENPLSTQGWNRYSYVGNSPLNFSDPTGYCFLGCFFQNIFNALQRMSPRLDKSPFTAIDAPAVFILGVSTLCLLHEHGTKTTSR